MIRIVIIDGQQKWRKYFQKCLASQADFTIAGSGSDGYHALKLVDMYKPDIVLLDMGLPMGEGFKTVSLIKSRSPGTSIIGHTDANTERRFFSSFFSGISGFITKEADPQLLCHAIRTVYHGGRLMASEIASRFNKIAEQLAGDALKFKRKLRSDRRAWAPEWHRRSDTEYSAAYRPKSELPGTVSPSEKQIIGFLGQGLSYREIAQRLDLSEGTVRNYVSSVLQKTGLRDRTQVAIFALKAGL
ncbi:MAG: response regulator transcription factor [Spirochaetaceae bacterium]|jgi:DNA-binding NarL/FixJ family response regulator|nr:response regulator transcription factor [Spirochaetaceae bacterium]